MYSILIADDDPLVRRTVRTALETDLNATVIEAVDGAAAWQRLQNESGQDISLALIDLNMPVMDGMSLLRQIKKSPLKLPCIVLTGSDRMEDAVEAMQLGAVDFISKPARRARLITSVRNALEIHKLKEEVKRLPIEGTPQYAFRDITEVSPSLKETAELARKAATSDMPVLITGESGVGKEVFARALHGESDRKDKPFVPVNCGALPENLVESTLFGHEKGAFTGAVMKSIGKCREADGGTLFLDEVGELKLDAQVKLLRVLQQGEIEPVGSGKPMKVDIRIISATNRSLEQMVTQGRFREDLYYRLQGLPLHIPPLRDRIRDIPSLAQHLLERIALHEQRPNLHFTPEAIAWLTSYRWPGNVREMQHVLSRAVLLAENDTIQVNDLVRMSRAQPRAPTPSQNAVLSIQLEGPNGEFKTLEQIEQEVIEAALARYDAHIGRAAAALGVGQSTLYKRMRKRSA